MFSHGEFFEYFGNVWKNEIGLKFVQSSRYPDLNI